MARSLTAGSAISLISHLATLIPLQVKVRPRALVKRFLRGRVTVRGSGL